MPAEMDLKEFVCATLTQIVQGVLEAQKALQDTDAEVCPAGIHLEMTREKRPSTKNGVPLQEVSFDIAVTVSETSSEERKRSGGAGVRIYVLSFAATGENARQERLASSTVNRISFSVPLLLPVHRRRGEDPASGPEHA